jgi:hypothetical protein
MCKWLPEIKYSRARSCKEIRWGTYIGNDCNDCNDVLALNGKLTKPNPEQTNVSIVSIVTYICT